MDVPVEKAAEFSTLCEIFPDINPTIVRKIFKSNGYDVEAATEAALAYTTSLSAEDTERRSSSASSSELAFTKTAAADQSVMTKTNKLGDIPISPIQSVHSPRTTPLNMPLGQSGDELKEENSLDEVSNFCPGSMHEHTIVSPVEATGEQQKKSKSWSNPMILPEAFLKAPRFRLTIDSYDEESIYFSLMFNRKNSKLGLSIAPISSSSLIFDSEIRVEAVSNQPQPEEMQPQIEYYTVARDAGIRIGDTLVGVNNQYFSPGAEVEDVVSLLELSEDYVTMRFRRLLSTSDDGQSLSEEAAPPASDPSLHKLAKLLMDQNLINSTKAEYVTKCTARLKERVLQWDTGVIAEERHDRIKSMGLIGIRNYDETLRGSDDTKSRWGRRSFAVYNRESLEQSYDLAGMYDDHPINRNSQPASYKNSLWSAEPGGSAGNIVVHTKDLRPAISARILRAEHSRSDSGYMEYFIWVMDIRSGFEWTVRKRFREFYVFWEKLISIRSSISTIEFPAKRLMTSDDERVVAERMSLLQRFLKKAASLVCVNSLHPTTAQIQRELQKFLGAEDRLPFIKQKENRLERNIPATVAVYVHFIMQINVMERVLDGFLQQFLLKAVEDERNGLLYKYNIKSARAVVKELSTFINSLQGVLHSGLVSDCASIFDECRRRLLDQWGVRWRTNSMYSTDGEEEKLTNTSVDSDTAIGVGLEGQMTTPAKRLAALSNEERQRLRTWSTMSTEQDEKREREDAYLLSLQHFSQDEIQAYVRAAVRRQVEIEVYVVCANRIRSILNVAVQEDQKMVRKKIAAIRNMPQSFFGIIPENISPSGWQSLVEMFTQIRSSRTLPQDRIEHLVQVCKTVPVLHKREHTHDTSEGGQPQHILGADEFLPIFIYIMVRADVPEIVTLLEELTSFADPDSKLSETGYYLATLEAAIEHIREYDLNGNRATLISPNELLYVDGINSEKASYSSFVADTNSFNKTDEIERLIQYGGVDGREQNTHPVDAGNVTDSGGVALDKAEEDMNKLVIDGDEDEDAGSVSSGSTLNEVRNSYGIEDEQNEERYNTSNINDDDL